MNEDERRVLKHLLQEEKSLNEDARTKLLKIVREDGGLCSVRRSDGTIQNAKFVDVQIDDAGILRVRVLFAAGNDLGEKYVKLDDFLAWQENGPGKKEE